jgi:hypothetical protein
MLQLLHVLDCINAYTSSKNVICGDNKTLFPTPIKHGLKMQREEKKTLLAQMKPPLPHFLPLYPQTTANRYAHL